MVRTNVKHTFGRKNNGNTIFTDNDLRKLDLF